jgi:hypothetical protein
MEGAVKIRLHKPVVIGARHRVFIRVGICAFHDAIPCGSHAAPVGPVVAIAASFHHEFAGVLFACRLPLQVDG